MSPRAGGALRGAIALKRRSASDNRLFRLIHFTHPWHSSRAFNISLARCSREAIVPGGHCRTAASIRIAHLLEIAENDYFTVLLGQTQDRLLQTQQEFRLGSGPPSKSVLLASPFSLLPTNPPQAVHRGGCDPAFAG